MTRLPIESHPLTVSERAVLERILSADLVGASTLRSQLDRTEAGTGRLEAPHRRPLRSDAW